MSVPVEMEPVVQLRLDILNDCFWDTAISNFHAVRCKALYSESHSFRQLLRLLSAAILLLTHKHVLSTEYELSRCMEPNAQGETVLIIEQLIGLGRGQLILVRKERGNLQTRLYLMEI